ncbi:MAG TPA: alanine racemase [Acidimicrobiales bacterium]|nr:alanine racemase [Acidimicrobiales bacterium]
MRLADVPTPALVVDRAAFDHNVATMGAVNPGRRLRPHVKAFKSTALARALAGAGHEAFSCATVREVEGLVAAGLGGDLLLANEVLDCTRLGAVVGPGTARVTVAVDSEETIDAAAGGGVREVLVDVNVGLPRCGCDPADAGRLADLARARGLTVRGVMGYEGHLMRAPRDRKVAEVERAMARLLAAGEAAGGDVVSAGGTGTYDCNPWATEIQAGSYCLMDTEYLPHAPAFRHALFLWTSVISVNRSGWAVVDAGLKALGMDHGDPTVVGGTCWFVSDEHTTFGTDPSRPVAVGDRLTVLPAHVDPTVALHERMVVVDAVADNRLDGDAEVVDEWPVDLRGW